MFRSGSSCDDKRRARWACFAFSIENSRCCQILRFRADSVAEVGESDLQRNGCSSMDNVLNLSFKVGAADESMLRAR
jgi:hypothetical protein